MTWLELAGTPGAGKSTLMPVLIETLSSWGREARALQPARLPIQNGGLRALDRLHASSAFMRFAGRHARLSLTVARNILEAPLPAWHKRTITALMVALAAADQIQRPKAGDRIIVVDEGWSHRAVNVFAWHAHVSKRDLEIYFRQMPRPDAVVVVDAPTKVRAERLARRGLPKRLRDKDADVVAAFLSNAEDIAHRTAEWLLLEGVPLVRVVNDASLDAAAERLSAAVPDLMPGLAR